MQFSLKRFPRHTVDLCQIEMRWSVLHFVVNCVTPSTDDASLTTMAVLKSGGNVGRATRYRGSESFEQSWFEKMLFKECYRQPFDQLRCYGGS